MRITKSQKERLFELVAAKPYVRAGKFHANFTYKDARREWELISLALNAIPGARKSWKAWRKTWQDITSKVKQKCATMKRERKGSGEGLSPDPLDDYEEGLSHHSSMLEPAISYEGSEELDTKDDAIVRESGRLSHAEVLFYNDDVVIPLPHFLDTNASGFHTPAKPPTVITSTNERTMASDVAVDLTPSPVFKHPAPPPPDKPKMEKRIMKSLLKEKVLLKREMLKEKKKFYAAFLANMERQTKALENICETYKKKNNIDH